MNSIDQQHTPLTTTAAEHLLHSQLNTWQTAHDNYIALNGVRVKSVNVDGMPFKVQFNPARIVSSGAKVDAASVKARPCFLCSANRPDQQQGLSWGEYTVLVNPFPIFPRHFTIPLNDHSDQRIFGRIASMMKLAQALVGYTVFYNGPRCGASAPDHMHFQAGNSDFLTMPTILESAALEPVTTVNRAQLQAAPNLPMGVFVIDATDVEAGEHLFNRLYDILPRQFAGEEPMMNLLCYATADGVRLVVIPRVKHRPSCYGTGGDNCMLLSPASVDVGGVFITPLEKDFKALDADKIKMILSEVCMTWQQIKSIADRLK